MLQPTLFLTAVSKLILFSWFFFNAFNTYVTGCAYFQDFSVRLNLNDSIINFYHFFWTNLNYLPSFFFLILGLFTLGFPTYYRRVIFWVLAIMFMLYNVEFADFWGSMLTSDLRDTSLTTFNVLLTNNLNKYHPFIFYVSVLITGASFGDFTSRLGSHYNFQTASLLSSFEMKSKFIIMINFFALYLGSWWALQEGTWGGWWNWDASEVFGLLFAFGGLRVVHTTLRNRNITRVYYWIQLYLLFLTLVYFFIQLNFDLVSHNFGAKFFFFFSNNFFFLEVIVTLTFGVLLTIGMINRSQSCELLIITPHVIPQADRLHSTRFTALVPYLYLALGLLVINSFLPLINYFFWNLFKLDTLNFELPLVHLILGIVLTLIVIGVRVSRSITPVALAASVFGNPLNVILPILTPWSLQTTSLLHFFLLSFLALNLIISDAPYLYFHPVPARDAIYLSQHLLYAADASFTCDSFCVDYVTYYFNPWLRTAMSSYNIFYFSNTPSINTFILYTSNSLTLNLYHLNHDWFTTFLYLETTGVSDLNTFFSLSLLIFIYSSLRLGFTSTVVRY